MGVIYKLKDEVVRFIISQRQDNPLSSCRQLAESASQKFGLNLSKSSVHDVLKESGIITPRGRKPKDKFEIPHEKKKQIQVSLSQIKLLPDPVAADPVIPSASPVILPDPSVILSEAKDLNKINSLKEGVEISAEYDGAGKVFLKAALWDLGIFSEENIKETDWMYYLTYSKGVKIDLENNKNFFIDLPLPLERCIKEVADGLVNNIKPFIVHKISDEELFKASMNNKTGFKINTISIVEQNNHIMLELNNIMECKREYLSLKRTFMHSNERIILERSKALFFSQIIENNSFIENIMNLKGFDTTDKNENTVTLLINDSYENKTVLLEAAEKLNEMFLRDEQGKLVNVVVKVTLV